MEKLPLTLFLQIFEELYLSIQDFSWVIDKDPGLGFTGVISTITSDEASHSPHIPADQPLPLIENIFAGALILRSPIFKAANLIPTGIKAGL